MKANEKTVFKKAIEAHGIQDQTQIAYEKLAELIKALTKYQLVLKYQAYDKRKLQRAKNGIVEKVAEVGISLDQIKLMYDITDKMVSEARDAKVNELDTNLDLNPEVWHGKI